MSARERESVTSALTLMNYQARKGGAVIAGIVAIVAPIMRERESNERNR
jgi:hypothetical protein